MSELEAAKGMGKTGVREAVAAAAREPVAAVAAAAREPVAAAAARLGAVEKLGIGLRLCQAYFASAIAVGLAYAFALPPSALAYDLTLAYALLQMVVAALSIWMIGKRLRAARPFAVVGAVLCCSLWALDMIAFGAYGTLAGHVGDHLAALAVGAQYAAGLAVVSFIALAPQARTRLSEKVDRTPQAVSGHSWDEPLRERVRTWPFWRDLLIYFMVFSFLGHWAEMWFCYNIYLGVFMGDYDFSQAMLWSQWLFPYTAEGVAIIAIALILHPAKEALLKRTGGRVVPALVASVAVTALVCTTIDFTCGMIANRDYSLWDYRELPFNFMGQVCLQNSTVYTVAATLIVWVFYPLMDRGLMRMPRTCADGLFVTILAVYAFCALLHFMYLTPAGLVVGV